MVHFDDRKNLSRAESPGRRFSLPRPSAPLSPVLALQEKAGNAAVTRAIQRSVGDRPDAAAGNAGLTRAVQRSLHEHGPGCAHGQVDVQRRVADRPVVQRMEDERGRGYEADHSSSEHGSGNSSPERRALNEQVQAGLADLEGIAGRMAGLAEERPFPRMRRVLPESSSESESSPERPAEVPAAAGHGVPARQQPPGAFPDSSSEESEGAALPTHSKLSPLHALLEQEMADGDLTKKLKVTFSVSVGDDRSGGHAWMVVTGSGGQEVSFGFFPDRNADSRFADVPGGVLCPDPLARHYDATHHESKNATLSDIIKGYRLVHGRAEANYNFTMHNCTTFATQVWKKMTNKDIPANLLTTMGLLSLAVSNPKAADEGLATHQKRRTDGRRERYLKEGRSAEEAERLARERESQSSSTE